MSNRRQVRTAQSARPRGLRLGQRLSIVTMTIVSMAILGAQTGAQGPRPNGLSEERYPNFDIRREKHPDAPDYMEKHAAVRTAGLVASIVDARAGAFARLGASGKRLAVVNSEILGSVEVLGVEGRGVLAEPAADRVSALRAFLADYAGAYGLSTQQLAELELVADYANPTGNMAWVEFEQRLNGLPVFQGSIRGGFTAKGELARTAGHLAPALDATNVATAPSLSA